MKRATRRPVALMLALMLMAASLLPALATIEAEEAFFNTWARTDSVVSDGTVDRTWMWGPAPISTVITEPYADHPLGERTVQYQEKSRMEVNNPNAEYDGLWYVTNGLLVVELMDGNIQVGDNEFEAHTGPAHIQVAGDPSDSAPSYATFGELRSAPSHEAGSVITATVDGDGTIGSHGDLSMHGVTAGPLSPETGHRTASVFWEFMNSSGLIWDWESNQNVTDRLFENAYYATGLPVTEAYWVWVAVQGTEKWVLTQAFERRVLTYTPGNNEGWLVEAGNVGTHYYAWRYGDDPVPPPPPPAQDFTVFLGSLNESGVHGMAMMTLYDGMLTISVEIDGLEAEQPHPMHLHGFEDGQAHCPIPSMAGEDGYIQFADGQQAFGPVVLNLTPVETAGEDGNISYTKEYPFGGSSEDLVSLVMVVHGMTIDEDYVQGLPVACGAVLPEAGFYSELGPEGPVVTDAYGFTTFHMPADHTQMTFTLVTYGLVDITMAHVHLAEVPGGNGPPVVWLPDMTTELLDANGIIASSTFGDADFVGPAAGWSMQQLIEAFDDGRAYVNVHTAENPGGEIRGDMVRVADLDHSGHPENGENGQNGNGNGNGDNGNGENGNGDNGNGNGDNGNGDNGNGNGENGNGGDHDHDHGY